MPRVEVNRPGGGRWVRYFKTDEEAIRYKQHMTHDRACLAEVIDADDKEIPFHMTRQDWALHCAIYEAAHRTENIIFIPEDEFEDFISEHGKEKIKEYVEEL